MTTSNADLGIGLYGGKCHLCTDLDGSAHDVEPIDWLPAVRCARCSFCQERALSKLISRVGLMAFAPEVRRAVQAFRRGEDDPLIDQLRTECQVIDVSPNDGSPPEADG